MGTRIPKRTKEEIARDVAFVLKSDLHPATKRGVLNSAMWGWTLGARKKYEGCEHKSVRASAYIFAFAEEKANYEKSGRMGPRPRRSLIHDHAVPRKVVRELLGELDPITPKTVFDCCQKFLHGVTIMPEEDRLLNKNGYRQKMPKEFHDRESAEFGIWWLRYQRCGIELYPSPLVQ